ncbi:MAG: SDR family oxidoreductase [Actinobacteria bacterium]|nr:SDR family oxidoreductase [Actinomycetota bacterium]
MKDYYENRVAVVTGGASGIGLALCEEMLSLGAKAVVAADLNEEKLESECSRLEGEYPGRVLGVPTDVTDKQSVFRLIERAAAFGDGRIDLLFNNAGLGLMKPFDDTTDEDWKFAFDINFYGALHGVRAALPVMRAQGGGHIANTASGIVFSPMPFQSMYSATKAALMAFTTSLRSELWDDNIRLSTVIPGTVATPIWEKAGGAPPSAITPRESALGILKGVAANQRIIILTEEDLSGARNAFLPENMEYLDQYFLEVARRRRSGDGQAI